MAVMIDRNTKIVDTRAIDIILWILLDRLVVSQRDQVFLYSCQHRECVDVRQIVETLQLFQHDHRAQPDAAMCCSCLRSSDSVAMTDCSSVVA